MEMFLEFIENSVSYPIVRFLCFLGAIGLIVLAGIIVGILVFRIMEIVDDLWK